MGQAKMNFVVTSRRIYNKAEAAEYCGLPPKVFATLCPVTPIRFSERHSGYDVRDLDRWLDGFKAGADDSNILDRLG